MSYENQDLRNNPEVMEIPVLCINWNCHNTVLVKNALIGLEAGDFYCSEKCKQDDLTRNDNH